MADNCVTIGLDQALTLCVSAAIRAGASPLVAMSLAKSVVAAQAEGQQSVGLAHFIDYLDALAEGRIDGQAVPAINRPAPAFIVADARGGAAHPGFDLVFDDLVAAARGLGVAIFSQKNSYTAGALGYFAARLARQGLVAIATANGPPLLAGSGGTRPVYCTNPLAFAAPVADGPPLLIDQSSSATAFVNIRDAAHDGRAIPIGWALDDTGQPTTDPHEAMKGALVAFGGERGANIALMVEVLSAGLSGANWSLDAPSFTCGSTSPGAGLFVLAIAPQLLDPDFAERMKAQMERLARDYGVHIPGGRKAEARNRAETEGLVVPRALFDRIAGGNLRSQP